MHVGPLVGAAVALLSDSFFGANAQLQILIVLTVAIVARELVDLSNRGKRDQCRRAIAETTRSLLDEALDLTRTDRVHLGDFLTLRRIATRAKTGAIRNVSGFGGPADTLTNALWAVAATYETSVGRCYGKLNARDQSRVDAFADVLREAAARAGGMTNPPSGDYEIESARLYGQLAEALARTAATGDEIDRHFDATGYRATAKLRATDEAARRGREWDAAEILRANAREAAEALGQGGPLNFADLENVADRIRRARDVALGVDTSAFAAATDAVRAAHRRITYGDLFDALERVQQVRRGDGDGNLLAEARLLLDRLWDDVMALEQVKADSD